MNTSQSAPPAFSPTGVEKRPEHHDRGVIWQIAARRGTYKKLSKRSALYKAKRKIKKAKVQFRVKVEHPLRVIKRQFGYTKVRFRDLAKNTAQLSPCLLYRTYGWHADIRRRIARRGVPVIREMAATRSSWRSETPV